MQHLERLDQMASFLQVPAHEFIIALKKDLNISMFVIYTWRSPATQQSLFEQGRAIDRETGEWVITAPKLVVTNAAPGQSPHNATYESGNPASVAMDLVPMSEKGTLLWETPLSQWQKIFTYAWKFGFDPLGDTIGASYERDRCHFEEPNWKQKYRGLDLVMPTAVHI